MDWTNIIQQLLEICVIPLLGLLVTFLINFLTSKTEEAKAKTDNETKKKYLDMLNETVVDCVKATHQTYVEALKKDNAFSKENQQEALEKTYQNVLTILSDDSKKYLSEACGDLEFYIKNKIEASVQDNKK